jgi:hypothetical protein
MCPLFTKVVRDTMPRPDVTTKLQLDPAKIPPCVDDGKLDEAGEELVKQLMGTRVASSAQGKCKTIASLTLHSECVPVQRSTWRRPMPGRNLRERRDEKIP